MATSTITPWAANVIRRIQFSHGGNEDFWAQLLTAYIDAQPWLEDTEVLQFDNEDAFNIVLNEVTRKDGQPVTAGEAIEEFQLWDFFASEYYWSTKSEDEQQAARPSWSYV